MSLYFISLNYLSKTFSLPAPCIVPYISHGYIEDRASGSIIGKTAPCIRNHETKVYPLQVTTSPCQCPACLNSNPVTTPAWSATMERGHPLQSVSQVNLMPSNTDFMTAVHVLFYFKALMSSTKTLFVCCSQMHRVTRCPSQWNGCCPKS